MAKPMIKDNSPHAASSVLSILFAAFNPHHHSVAKRSLQAHPLAAVASTTTTKQRTQNAPPGSPALPLRHPRSVHHEASLQEAPFGHQLRMLEKRAIT